MLTVILFAGSPDYRNMVAGQTGSPLMSLIKGRPAAAWVMSDFLKHAEGEAVLVVRAGDTEFLEFLNRAYGKNARIHVVAQPEVPAGNILYSTRLGLEHGKLESETPVRIILGDTLIRNTPYTQGDVICTSVTQDVSEKWCLTQPNEEGKVTHFFDKVEGLNTPSLKTVVGRYEFADGAFWKTCVEVALAQGDKELSAALALYATHRPFTNVDVDVDDWIDFGHLEGIAKANRNLMESRSFNSIRITSPIIRLIKKSVKAKKLEEEYFWYQHMPEEFQPLVPRIFALRKVEGGAELEMEYYGYPTLAEKLVYTRLSTSFWQSALENLFGLVVAFQKARHAVSADTLKTMYAGKTFQRMEELRGQSPFWDKVLGHPYVVVNGEKLLNFAGLKSYIQNRSAQLAGTAQGSVVHGDLCFNNILYDFSSGIVKLIDPRGSFGGEMSVYGDIRYDVAKLRHSFCGGYDHVTHELFSLEHDESGAEATLHIALEDMNRNESLFDALALQYGFCPSDIRFMEALLFLSMIPLHNDSLDKQKAFFYNGLMKMNRCFVEDHAQSANTGEKVA
jgi:hypothetical protein